jgi:hypothetical protein
MTVLNDSENLRERCLDVQKFGCLRVSCRQDMNQLLLQFLESP